MFKKIALMSVLALATSSAFANGFYIGAQLGGNRLHAKDTVTGTTSVGLNTYSFSSNNANNAYGVTGGLLAGYAWTYPNQFYLGAEIFTNATSAKASDKYQDTQGNSYSNDLKLRYNYGVRALPGYAVTPETVAYGILGFVRGNFKFEDNSSANVVASAGNETYNVYGYQVGVGAMTDLADNLGLRGDVAYTDYQSKTINWTDTSGNVTGSGSNKFKASTIDASVALVYKFG